ncbi:6-carboxyhexanoate--CoA ligase [Falsiroseomonas bella]|uniref:6-carboxyhexanoate--CoA ligase n=1 Tax=Falsiroseomonas bella TaxID=2184016 RepID=A0A317FGH0_9PROT|nr:acetate--CoA ligase family protein [Falsiroseomonas bella]PWS37049.1 6-carboxyhexanoate--CoA ligase [Falsiroseomonas bella]
MSGLERLLRPRSVAIIGASADVSKTTGRPVGYLQRHGFGGEIWPVNPRVAEISGLRCHPDVASLPAAPDVGIVLLGADRAEDAVRVLATRGTAAAIVLAGGFAESGGQGGERQARLKAAAGGMRLLGPNTIGLVNLTDRIVLSASGALEMEEFFAGRIALVSQSGGILGAVLSRGAAQGIGFSSLVATGNEADLDVADLVDHLAEDAATDVIALYVEGLRRPDAFRAAARKAHAAGKRIVAFKVGRSEAGAQAAISHTGALAGADRLYDALFRQLGILRADRFSDLLDIAAALATRRVARGRRVAVLTSTGGAGALLADSFGLAGFSLPPPDAATADRLAQLTGEAAVANPLDLTLAGLKPEVMNGAIAALLESPGYDALAVVVGSSALAKPRLAADAIAAGQAISDKPVIAYLSPHAPQIGAALQRQGIPAASAPEAVATMLSALATAPVHALVPSPAAGVQAVPSGPMDEAESKALFARFGIAPVREVVCATPEDAQAAAAGLGGTVVLKALSKHLAHKSDVGGVRIGVPAQDVAAEGAAMLARVAAATGRAPEGLLVQEQLREGVEMILGLQRDPHLGTAILLGMGGVAAELFGDTALRLLPIGRAAAEGMLDELRGAGLLRGYRGRPRADVAALLDAVLAFARMGEALGARLETAEINPLFVLPEGEGVRAADALAILA